MKTPISPYLLISTLSNYSGGKSLLFETNAVKYKIITITLDKDISSKY